MGIELFFVLLVWMMMPHSICGIYNKVAAWVLLHVYSFGTATSWRFVIIYYW